MQAESGLHRHYNMLGLVAGPSLQKTTCIDLSMTQIGNRCDELAQDQTF